MESIEKHRMPDIPSGKDIESLKDKLLTKYRVSFVNRLNRSDLEDLQTLLQKTYDADRALNREQFTRFVFRLRQYFHEETLTRELAGIETLVSLLKPEDLKK